MAPTLRASCDSCHQAKVKCTKTKPHCARCTKHNIDCIYGISLRAGKKASQHHQKQQAPPPKPEAIVSPQFQNDWSLDFSASPATYAPNDIGLPHSMFAPSRLDDYLLTEEPMPDMGPADSKMMDYAPMSMPSPTLSSPSRSWSTGSTSMTSPSQSSCSQSYSPALFPTCNCFQTTINTLSTMQQLSDSTNTSLDVALNHNKEAVALCSSVLNCRCAGECSSVMLIASLIAKIIATYERPCDAWKPMEHSSPSQDTMGDMNARLRLGSYSVDESDEERLKTEIVRMELRKVEPLIARLRDITSDLIQESEKMVCEGLAILLSEKLRNAYDIGDGFHRGGIT